MNKSIFILGAILIVLLFTPTLFAQSAGSTNYKNLAVLDNGGGGQSSTNYNQRGSINQNVIGEITSTSYKNQSFYAYAFFVIVATSPPAAPSNLQATAVASSQINLTWTDNSDNEQGFMIEMSTDGVNFAQIATVGTNTTIYYVTGLSPSTTYWFRVKAYNTAGSSAYSNTASATTPAAGVNVTIATDPTGLQIIVDSFTYTAPQTFNWPVGSTHTIGVNSPQAVPPGTQYVWSSWSDGGNQTHTITVTSTQTITASFNTEYYLTTQANPSSCGTVSPISGWQSSGATVVVQATPNTGYVFAYWSGDLTGGANPTTLLMNSPKTVAANFLVAAATVNASVSFDFSNPTMYYNWTFIASDPAGQVKWKIDGAPASMPGNAYFTPPYSLNYNNDIDYNTPGTANYGYAFTPPVDISGLASPRLKFMCNFQTDDSGTSTDWRIVQVSNDNFVTFLINQQLSTGAGGCSGMGVWHEHVINLNPAWGTIRVRFYFDTVNASNNNFAGWFIDDVEISDLLVTAINQYRQDGSIIPLGGSAGTTQATAVFKGIVSAAAIGAVELQVEVQPIGINFTGIPTATATGAGAGSAIQVSVQKPVGDYHWRARTVELGTLSSWMSFGGNLETQIDFFVASAEEEEKNKWKKMLWLYLCLASGQSSGAGFYPVLLAIVFVVVGFLLRLRRVCHG